MGAVKKGNRSGTIPIWTGGITQPVNGYTIGAHHPDPFSKDQVLFKINHANVGKFSDKLSKGQIALLKANTDHYLKIYPTRRSSAYSQKVYDAVRKNATTAALDDNGNGVKNSKIASPFPIPKNALEVMWNHILRYRGEFLHRKSYSTSVDRSGKYVPLLSEDKIRFNYALGEDRNNKLLVSVIQRILEPPRLTGGILLVREAVNQAQTARQAWSYHKGQRRVRRAPSFAYDAYQSGSDGLRTVDEIDMYNGSPDRYNWKLLGKREMYIPFNNYKAHSNEAKFEALMQKRHLNPEFLRYELHRVWVVEASLKKDKRHIYGKRTFYIDEDSWQITVVDTYNTHNELWRVAEGFSINYYQLPVQMYVLEVQHDLFANRYFSSGMHNGLSPVDFNVHYDKKNFRPVSIYRLGIR